MLILLVEDEKHIRVGIAEMLLDEGYQVVQAGTLDEALRMVESERPDVVLSDIHLPDGDGFSLLQRCRNMAVELPVIFMTAFGGRDVALQAISQGAYDYIAKPLRFDELFARLHRIRELQELRGQVQRDSARRQKMGALTTLGDSPAMCRVRRAAERAANSRAPVLILGETGVGKGMLAGLIHSEGMHRDRPMVSVNCASIPENLLESELFGYRKGAFTGAEGHKKGLLEEVGDGTLFLDEIGEMPLPLQAKLLHVLDHGFFRPLGGTRALRFTGRVVAATNVPAEELLQKKHFRSDLYYRLSVLVIEIPPLRERIEDLLPMAEQIYARLAEEMGRDPRLPPALAATIRQQRWPGNVRELRNYLERALIFGESADEVDATPPSLSEVVQRFERDWIRRAISECGGDKAAAARRLGIGLSTLYRKMGDEV